MDFQTLMSVASAKQENKDKMKINRYSLELPPAKKEVKDFVPSDVIKKLILEKENERKIKGKLQKAKEHKEKKSSQFRIPKKKEPEKKAVNTEKLINSLFDDTEDDNSINGQDGLSLVPIDFDTSSNKEKPSISSSSSSFKSSTSSSRSKDKLSSLNEKDNRVDENTKSSHHSSKSSKSLSHDDKSHSSSNSRHSSSSQSKSTSSDHGSKSSKSSSSSSHSKSHSSAPSRHKSSTSSSSSKSSSKSSSSISSLMSSPPPQSSTSHQDESPAVQPVTLAKHHLKPVVDRQVNNCQMSEKEKILAKLKAIKERTLAAINKEQEGKGKKSKPEKSPKKSSKKDSKEDDRVKSKEIVKDVYSSEDEEDISNVPSALDIMLSERQSKLEKEKISRMAKQAWERATRKNEPDDTDREKKRKKGHRKSSHSKSENNCSSIHSKRKEHSVSPDPGGSNRKKTKLNEDRPKKPKIVRHAGHAAPPPDFQAILAMAAQKVKEPVKTPSVIAKKKKKEDEGRPLTQEEKERKERTQSREYQHWLKYGGKCPNDKGQSSEEDDKAIPISKRKDVSAVRSGKESGHSVLGDGVKPDLAFKQKGHSIAKYSNEKSEPTSSAKSKAITMNENVLVCGPADEGGVNGRHEDLSDNPFDRIYKSVHKKKLSQEAAKRVQLDESDEEEDSDMDGFIDDGSDEDGDYSKHISKIFGYNKDKYADEDENVSDMEADFASVMKEEKRSAKIGRMEDLEDMRREEEELKRKAMLKKKMRR